MPLQVIELNRLGRLLAYEPGSGSVRVLLDSLYMPNGIALSPDEDFLLLAETSLGRILRYTHSRTHTQCLTRCSTSLFNVNPQAYHLKCCWCTYEDKTYNYDILFFA